MLSDDKDAEIQRLRDQIALLEAEYKLLQGQRGRPCHCAAPLITESPGGYPRCRICKGYITAHYIIGLQREIGDLRHG